MHVKMERRNLIARRMLTERVRNEFKEMPCLTLTLAQASRLFGLPQDACARVMSELARTGQITSLDQRYRASR